MAEKMTLEPCPFCGGEAVAENYIVEAQAVCLGCRAKIARSHGAHTDNGLQEAIEAWNRRAHLAQPAQAVDVDEAMVERALTYRAMQEDGAVWPDAYGADEQAAEREQMRNVLAAALNTQGPKAYCRSCQRAGMRNCGYFDECSGATCITCHRPLTRAIPTAQAEEWMPIATAPKGKTEILICGGTYAVGTHSDQPLTQPVIAFWDRDHWHGPEDNGHDLWWECKPTIWQPLPAPPQPEE